MIDWDNAVLIRIEVFPNHSGNDYTYFFDLTGSEPFSIREFVPSSDIYKRLEALEKNMDSAIESLYKDHQGEQMSESVTARRDGLKFQLAQLRHAYTQLVNGHVKDPREFADGLIAPAIRKIEELLDD